MVLIQFSANCSLFFLSLFGIIFNRRNLLLLLMCIELILLSLNSNFLIFSVYLDDLYGELFSFFILTMAASESAIGLAIIIIYYRVRGKVEINNEYLLKF